MYINNNKYILLVKILGSLMKRNFRSIISQINQEDWICFWLFIDTSLETDYGNLARTYRKEYFWSHGSGFTIIKVYSVSSEPSLVLSKIS